MNWKIILIISSLINFILLMFIFNKYQISHDDYIFKLDQSMELTEYEINRQSEFSRRGVRYRLDKQPKLKKPISKIFLDIENEKDEINEFLDAYAEGIQSDVNDTSVIGMNNRIIPLKVIEENDRINYINNKLEDSLDSLSYFFEMAIDTCRKELYRKPSDNYIAETKNKIPNFDFKSKLEKIKGASVLESKVILNSIKLDIANVVSVYTNRIIDVIPRRGEYEFEKLKVVINPKNNYVKHGEQYEADLGIVLYSPVLAKSSVFTINGKEYHADEEGLIHYKEKARSLGKRTLKLKVKVNNKLTGEIMSSSSTFDYQVIP